MSHALEDFGSKSKSNLSSTEILRNIAHVVDESGNQIAGIGELLNAIAINTAWLGIHIDHFSLSSTGIITNKEIIFVPNDKRLVIFAAGVSLDGLSDFKFSYSDGTAVLLPLFAPNDGQGWIQQFNPPVILEKGKPLNYNNTVAVDHGIMVNYSLVDAG